MLKYIRYFSVRALDQYTESANRRYIFKRL